MPSRKMRTAISFFYGLDAEIRPKSGVPHHPPELFIHLGEAIGTWKVGETVEATGKTSAIEAEE